jgi:enoyl-CoA hydratase
MGARKAKEMLFMGGRMTAAEAHRIGMVNKVVARSNLEAETLAMARHIARAEPFALKLVKRSINRTLDAQGLRTALHAHFDTHQLSHVTEAFKAARQRGLETAIKKAKE